MADSAGSATLARASRTRHRGVERRLVLLPPESGRNESAAIARLGRCSQPRIARPSAGNAARMSARCAATRRSFVRLSATTTHCATVAGCQPSGAAIVEARRRRLSETARRLPTSASSVLSSTRSKVRDAACQATRSTTPRSSKWLNETSGRTSQPAFTRIRVTRSAIAAWRDDTTISIPAPRQLGSRRRRTSSTPATLRSLSRGTLPIRPCSISGYADREMSAAIATRRCGQPSLSRSSRKSRPIARSSIRPG